MHNNLEKGAMNWMLTSGRTTIRTLTSSVFQEQRAAAVRTTATAAAVQTSVFVYLRGTAVNRTISSVKMVKYIGFYVYHRTTYLDHNP